MSFEPTDRKLPLVTVVIPTYRRATFLSDAIESVLAQTVHDIEVIVVEDGSEEARGTVEAYGPRVRYVWQKNQGPSEARNTGARWGRAPWIATLDDDDYWLPEKLERQLDLAARSPKVGLCHTDNLVSTETGLVPSERARRGEVSPSGWIARDLLLFNSIITSSALIRREAYDAVGGFDSSLRFSEDFDLWVRLARRYEVGYVNAPLTVYRVHPTNISRVQDLRHSLVAIDAFEGLLAKDPAIVRDYGIRTVAEVRYRLHAYCAYAHYYEGHYSIARRHFLVAWRWRPGRSRLLAYALACTTGVRTVRAARLSKRWLTGKRWVKRGLEDRPRDTVAMVGRIRPRRVLFIENSIGLAGSTLSLCTLLRHLDRDAISPFVLVSRTEQLDYARKVLDPSIPIALMPSRAALNHRRWRTGGVPVSRLRSIGESIAETLSRAWYLWREVQKRRIDLIHHNNGFDTATVLAARGTGVPLLMYQRGREWNSRLTRLLAPWATHYVANSSDTGRNLEELGVPASKISIVYPPIDMAVSATSSAGGGRLSIDLPERGYHFGIIGQLQRWKGQHVFLRAARQVLETLPSSRAVIVGTHPDGGEEYLAELESLTRELGIGDRVIFTGFLHDVPGLLRQLDVLVHASVSPEPFGRVIAEAMTAGVPVVASAAGGPTEFVENGRTGLLVPPGDDIRLAAAILTLLTDRELAARMSDAARREAVERFSPERHAERLTSTYLELLDRHGRAGRRLRSDRNPPAVKTGS